MSTYLKAKLHPGTAFSFLTAVFLGQVAVAEIPDSIPHQGRIAVSGINFDGTGQFKFLLFADPDANHASGNETAVWSNAATAPAGIAEPGSAVQIAVSKGLYGTWLGDTTITNMAALPASIEPPAGAGLYLRVWFNDGAAGFQALAPDQAIAAVPFALRAAGVTTGGITSDAISAGAVTGSKIAAGAVTGAGLANGSITAPKLAAGAVNSNALANDAVTGDKIAIGAVTKIGTPDQPGSISPGLLLQARGFDTTRIIDPTSVATSGNFAYVVDRSDVSIRIFDISDPDNIVPRDFRRLNLSNPTSVAVSGNFAYVVDSGTDRLQVFDISDPDQILSKGFGLIGTSRPTSVAVSGDFAYVVDTISPALQIYNVSNPNSLVAKDSDSTGMSRPQSVVVSGNFAYVVDSGSDRLQIFDISNPDIIVARDFDQTGLGFPTSVAVSGNFAYVVDSDTDRLQIFDISNPNNIIAKDFDQTGLSSPTSVSVSGNFAYVVDSDNARLQIFDVSDPNKIVAKDFNQTGLGSPRSVAVNGNIACVVDSATTRLQVFSASTGLTSPSGISLSGELHVNGAAQISELQVTGNMNAASANISGSVSADSYSFPAPKSFSLTISGLAMLQQNTSEEFFRSSQGFMRISQASGDSRFLGVAPVNLPQGAKITGMDILYFDNTVANSFTNFTTRLRRVPIFTATATEQNIISLNVTSPLSTNNTAITLATSNSPTVGLETVDNVNNTYFVSVDYTVSAPDDELKFYGFRIRYSLTSLAP